MVSEIDNSSMEAEQGLLGVLLVFPDKFDDISGILSGSDFAYPQHELIFNKISEYRAEGLDVSPVRLSPYFENLKDFPRFYLAELAGSVFSAINAVSYAETIRNYAGMRRFISTIEEFRYKSMHNPNADLLRSELVAALETGTQESVFARTKREAAAEFIESISLPSECYNIGIPSINKTMGGGLYAGFTYGFAGGEKSGKTTTAQTISHNLNRNQVLHAYIALEMGSKQIEQRNIARELGINSLEFLKEKKADYARRAADYLISVPDYTIYLDMAGCNFAQIKTEIQRLVQKKKIKGFILDYWQLVGSGDSLSNRSDFLFEVAQWIAGYCRRNNIFSIVLSQLNRSGQVLGSAGLERACDQLYKIGHGKNSYAEGLFMDLTHSRYTPTATLGSEESPRFEINYRSGPYLEEIL